MWKSGFRFAWVFALGVFLLLPVVAMAADEPVTIQFTMFGREADGEANQVLANEFTKRHPGIKVEVVTRPYVGFFDKLLTELISGVGPDLFLLDGPNVASFMHAGLAEPLDAYIEKAGIRFEDYAPAAWVFTQFQGHTYGVPREMGFPANGMVYNRALLDEAGIAYPDENWNWDDFRSIGKRLTRDSDGDGTVERWGARLGGVPRWINWLWSGGGRIFNDDLTEVLVDGPESIEALQAVADMIHQDKFASVGGVEPMANQEAAMALAPVQVLLKNPDTLAGVDWAVAPLPGKDMEGGVSQAGSLVVVMNKDSANKEAAWTYMQWLISEEGVRLGWEIVKNPPSLMSVALNSDFAVQDGPPYDMRPLLLGKWQNVPVFVNWGKASSLLNSTVGQVLSGELPASQAMAEISDPLAAILAESPDLQ